MGSQRTLFTVVVAVYNGASTIEDCLESITKQNFQNFELIVIDGNSTDGTQEIVSNFKQNVDYFISEPDNGIYDAWNKALMRAKGEWICFLGSDDLFRNNDVLCDFSKTIQSLEDDIDFVYSQVMYVNKDLEDIHLIGKPWEESFPHVRSGMPVPHTGMMHNRRVFDRGGLFDPTFKIAGDYDLFLRESKENNVVFIEGFVSTSMRQGGISSDFSFTKTSLRERRKAQKKYGILFPPLSWSVDMAIAQATHLIRKAIGAKNSAIFIDFVRQMFGLPKYWTKI